MDKKNISKDRKRYLRKIKVSEIAIFVVQISILVVLTALWEILANKGIIDSFIASQPSRIVKTFMNLSSNNLLEHLWVTCYETIVGFTLGSISGVIIAIILWWSKFLSKVAEPFLVVLNSLPKIALRTNHYYLGWCWHTSYYCNGFIDFFNCYNIRNFKWVYEYR